MVSRGDVTPGIFATVWRAVAGGSDFKDLFKALLARVPSGVIQEFRFQSFGPGFIPFICDLLLYRERMRDEALSQSLIQILIAIGSGSPSLETVLMNVAPVCEKTVPESDRDDLLDLCISDFQRSQSLFCLGVIRHIYEHDHFTIRHVFTVNPHELLRNSGETRFILDVCASFLDLGILRSISDDFVIGLIGVTDWEAVWNFFEKVDRNKLTDAALNKLSELLQSRQFERSPTFLRFVAFMVGQVNKQNGKVRVFQGMDWNRREQQQIIKAPLDLDEVLWQPLLKETGEMAMIASTELCRLYEVSGDFQLPISCFMQL
jgi:hypothetical protein